MYTIKELHRLREQERQTAGNYRLEPEWPILRAFSKDYFRVQTDAVQKYLTKGDTTNNPHFVYAAEADLLNKVVFGMSAQEFRAKHPNAGKKENMRGFASSQQLSLLFVLEASNAKYIAEGKSQSARLKLLEEDKARLLPSLNLQKKLK